MSSTLTVTADPTAPGATDKDPDTDSPFERDIADQAAALRDYAHATQPDLGTLSDGHPERIVLTGMGSSHFAALPSWRRLVAANRPVWWVDSGQLLDAPELVTPATVLVVTSQSGASGEVVALLDQLDGPARPAAIVGITNDPASPLGRRADVLAELRSGSEATVSTKSYLNTLLAHHQVTSALTGASADRHDVAGQMVSVVAAHRRPPVLDDIAAAFVAAPLARLAFVGFADQAATAFYAGLITKEGAKVAAEGYAGGQFRHGPLELAGPGLTAVLFAGDRDTDTGPLRQLADDLIRSGSTVLIVGPLTAPGAVQIATSSVSGPPLLAEGAVIAQQLTVALARARHITPGAFSFGSKITTTL